MLVGVDTGGTFTDFVALWPDGRCRIHKRRSTPDDPARAVIDGLLELCGECAGEAEVTYGSTVATNAVLERRGARVAVVTTAGFEDVLEIARQTRDDIYALVPSRPRPLVPRRRRLGVGERVAHDGEILQALDEHGASEVCDRAAALQAESIALCLLHSYANPAHEQALAAALRRRGFACSVSHELVPEYREYERLSTTVLNAYVAPVMQRHLASLAKDLPARRLWVLQSSGGAISVDTASREAVRTLLSGPAGGVVGARAAAQRLGVARVLTLDMGGTSTDVSLVDGAVGRQTQWSIAGLPVKVPAIDIHTVGAGGGSIARLDEGGALKVGPRSAGAVPGPACYGRGEAPTVTDADLVLGRLDPEAFLGGAMRIDVERARRAVSGIARDLGTTVEDAAEGIVRVVNASMERALRRISVERGHDARDYLLVSFGGAAGMHACELADGLAMRRVLVPRHPGVLSAGGAMGADIERSYVQTVRLADPSAAQVRSRLSPMLQRARRELQRECPGRKPVVSGSADLRYRGQSYEIEVAAPEGMRGAFECAHRRLYGYADGGRAVEVVNLRVTATLGRDLVPERGAVSSRSAMKPHRLRWRGRDVAAQCVERAALPRRRRTGGPLVITELSATTFVPPQWSARVVASGDLLLERE